MISQNPSFREVLGNKTLRQYINENATPYDFDTVLGPQPLETQVKRLGYDPGSFGTAGGQSSGGPGFSQYGQSAQQGPTAFIPSGRPNFGK
jgi:hypothetical protein